MGDMIYEPMLGESINETAAKVCRLVAEHGCRVRAKFNDIELIADGTNADGILAQFHAELDRRRKEYEASPQYKIDQQRQAESRRQTEAATAEGLLPFAVRDQAAWDANVKANKNDGYGACCLRYAARWANLMEKRIAAGEQLTDIAEKCSHEADVEGITGFMYGCAVGSLARAWVHGEALRRWHNKETQIGTEGDRANETGGVLNPAILNIGH